MDIFPIDGAPDDREEAVLKEAKFRRLKNKLEAISTHSTFLNYLSLLTKRKEWGRFVRKTYGFFFRKRYRLELLDELESICRQHDFSESKTVAVYCGSYGAKEVFPKSWVETAVPFTFEGLPVMLPVGYDCYLRQYYNNYMELPPVEKRISHHQKAYYNLEEREKDSEAIMKALK